MGKKKRLNGLPGNLVHRYFSSMFYWENGYMPDWIWFSAQEKGIRYLEIDILNEKVSPEELEINALVGLLPELRQTIYINLKSNNFSENYICEAKIYIEVPENEKSKFITGKAILRDIEGHFYEGKKLREEVYDKPFKVFPKTMNEKKHIANNRVLNIENKKWWKFWN